MKFANFLKLLAKIECCFRKISTPLSWFNLPLPREKVIPPSFTSSLPKLDATSDFFFSHCGCCPKLQLGETNFESKFEQNWFMHSAVNPLEVLAKWHFWEKSGPFSGYFCGEKLPLLPDSIVECGTLYWSPWQSGTFCKFLATFEKSQCPQIGHTCDRCM